MRCFWIHDLIIVDRRRILSDFVSPESLPPAISNERRKRTMEQPTVFLVLAGTSVDEAIARDRTIYAHSALPIQNILCKPVHVIFK